jgi:hypothetical protein
MTAKRVDSSEINESLEADEIGIRTIDPDASARLPWLLRYDNPMLWQTRPSMCFLTSTGRFS